MCGLVLCVLICHLTIFPFCPSASVKYESLSFSLTFDMEGLGVPRVFPGASERVGVKNRETL